jgi:hypothetical protein
MTPNANEAIQKLKALEKQDPLPCRGCYNSVPASELNATEHCTICAAIERLKDTLVKQGKARPERRVREPYLDL